MMSRTVTVTAEMQGVQFDGGLKDSWLQDATLQTSLGETQTFHHFMRCKNTRRLHIIY